MGCTRQNAKTYVAGHRGRVGSAIERRLWIAGYAAQAARREPPVCAWLGWRARPRELHRDELMADWALATAGELPYKIEPL